MVCPNALYAKEWINDQFLNFLNLSHTVSNQSREDPELKVACSQTIFSSSQSDCQ